MADQTGAGATLAIGTTLAATTIGEFEGDAYDVVGLVESIGPFGDTRTSVTFISLGDGRVRKSRGSADAGDMVVTYAFEAAGDDGQDALKTAFETASQSADEFNFRVSFNDQITPTTGNPTNFYFKAKIMSRQVQEVTTDGTILVQATLGINSPILEEAAV